MLPRLIEATRRDPHAVEHLNDCNKCMRQIPQQSRRYLACGYEQPVDGARSWQPSGYTGPEPTTCPGYTTKLPEVAEVVEARFYLEKGSLASIIEGQLTDNMKDAIAVLVGADAEVTRWALENPEKK